MSIVLIHGVYGNPDENWFLWVKDKLAKMGYTVFAPQFPTPENQTVKSWCGGLES